MTLSDREIDSIVSGCCYDPHALLGMHRKTGVGGLVVRVWDPGAKKIVLNSTETGKVLELKVLNEAGLFEAELPNISKTFKYSLYRSILEVNENGLARIHFYQVLPAINLFPLMKDGIVDLLRSWGPD